MATTATPWCVNNPSKLFLQSGQFTSTIKTSLSVNGTDTQCKDISWDGANTPWPGQENRKLYLQSGQFTSTLKASLDISAFDENNKGISWDGANTPWLGDQNDKLFLQSGQFNSTLKASQSIGSLPGAISFDGCDTPYCLVQKLLVQSGQFTSTVKTSQGIGGIHQHATGISFDGVNTPWSGGDFGPVVEKLFLQSGQFTSTVKTSEDVSAVDEVLLGIDTNDLQGRFFGIPPFEQATDQAEEDAATNTLDLWGGLVGETPVPGGGGGGGGPTPIFRIHAGFEDNDWAAVGSLYNWGQLAAGFTWEELAGRAVQDVDILAISITKKLASIRNRLTAGRCDFVLDNRDGRYSPDNANFAMRPNQPIGVKVITDVGSVYSLFAGFIDRYTINPAPDRMTANVGASDVAKLLRRKINLGLKIGVTPASLLEDVLVAAAIPPAFFDISTATLTDSISVSFIDNVPAGDAVDQIIKSGAHFMWVNNAGQLVFRPRGTDKGLTASQSYENNFFELGYSLNEESVVNDVLFKADPFRLPSTTQETVAWIENPVTLTVQGSLSMTLDYRDPLTLASPFPVNSIATPVSSDDYLMFEECNGSGANLTGQLTIAVIAGATSAQVNIVNNGCAGCLTKFQLRGIPLVDEPSISVPAVDLGSQGAHGTGTLIIEQNLITDPAHLKQLALSVIVAEPEPEVRFAKKNWYPDMYLLDLFQQVSLVESNTGISSLWLIEEMDHGIDLARGHQHTLTVRVRQQSP